ncbi:MAG: hypothetical protein J6S03_00520 [Bacteroidaceae bacterium]|nr:hypothetical protein [Bacteroidaceae bacterium]
MKRLIITIIACIFAFAAEAQSVEASHIFKGRSMKHQESTCTEGNSLKPYKLTLFSTATTQDRMHFRYIEEVIESNEDKAIDKECGYINGRLYYGFYQFKPNEKGRYRYIFYRNSSLREDEPCEITVVYMEGYPTLAELKKMFQK